MIAGDCLFTHDASAPDAAGGAAFGLGGDGARRRPGARTFVRTRLSKCDGRPQAAFKTRIVPPSDGYQSLSGNVPMH